MVILNLYYTECTEKVQVKKMIDKRIGQRFKECRERAGLTQEQLAEKTGVATYYISRVERGACFPRYENLIALLNGLGVSADAVFCDVTNVPGPSKINFLNESFYALPVEDQKRILDMIELMIKQANNK